MFEVCEEDFDAFKEIVQDDDFECSCIRDYEGYLDTVLEFEGTKEDVRLIFEKYKPYLLKMVRNSNELKDQIMKEDRSIIRHDMDFERSANLSKVSEDILNKDDNLSIFEERARVILILEVAKLINYYGMDELINNQDRISKEIALGIFSAKTDYYIPFPEEEKIERRIEVAESFGEESIPYIENLDLLSERLISLRNFTKKPAEIKELDVLIKKLELIRTMIQQKNPQAIPLLKGCYSGYEKINRKVLFSRLSFPENRVINNPNDDRLLLLHFIPDYSQDFDVDQYEFFDSVIVECIKDNIEKKHGRKFDEPIDHEEASDMLSAFYESRQNLFDLKNRIPIKNKYTNYSFCDVITAPHTNLSCSISKIGALHPHLDRKIAIGITSPPLSAIKTINVGYNNELDRFSFERNSAAIPDVLGYIEEEKGTNETLVDWTQIEGAYIMVMKDTPKISRALLKQAKEYSRITGLPLRIYDSYEIAKRKGASTLGKEHHPIIGSYTLKDLIPFAKLPLKTFSLKKIIESIAKGNIGGEHDEYDLQ